MTLYELSDEVAELIQATMRYTTPGGGLWNEAITALEHPVTWANTGRKNVEFDKAHDAGWHAYEEYGT